MGLGTWESYLANHIEGFLQQEFSSSLETVELMNGMEREVRHQASGKKRQDIDTGFIFSLNPEDYHRLCARRVIETCGRRRLADHPAGLRGRRCDHRAHGAG